MLSRFVLLCFVSAGAVFGQAAPPAVPDSVIAESNVSYSAVGGRQNLDIFRPRAASATPLPAVLLVHGGGFTAGAKEEYRDLAIKLAQRGYVAASANYRLAPRN